MYSSARESQIGFETGCILTGIAVHVFVLFLQIKVGPKENANKRWHVKVCQMKFHCLDFDKNYCVCDHTRGDPV